MKNASLFLALLMTIFTMGMPGCAPPDDGGYAYSGE